MSSNRPPASRLSIRLPATTTSATGTSHDTNASSSTVQDSFVFKSKPSQQQQEQLPKKWPKYSAASKPLDSPVPCSCTTDDVHLHHQITSLHFIHSNSKRQGRPAWCYKGYSVLYLSHVVTAAATAAGGGVGDKKTKKETQQRQRQQQEREIALHLRGGQGMKITKVHVFVPRFVRSSCNSNNNNNGDGGGGNKDGDDIHDDQTTEKDTFGKEETKVEKEKTVVQAKLEKVKTVTVQHHTPLDKILTKSPLTFTPLDFYPLEQQRQQGQEQEKNDYSSSSSSKRRYEADTQYCRGGQGMMDAIRCASIASSFGEVKIKVNLDDSAEEEEEDIILEDANGEEEEQEGEHAEKRTERVLKDLWRRDLEQQPLAPPPPPPPLAPPLLHSSLDNGQCGQLLKKLDQQRGGERRKQRLDLVCEKLVQKEIVNKNALDNTLKKNAFVNSKQQHVGGIGDTKTSTKGSDGGGNEGEESLNNMHCAMGFKVVLEFEMDPMSTFGNTHLGGIHFCTPDAMDDAFGTTSTTATTATPHVYTTSGIMGDHEGTRCWMPTIDTASSKHRATHELTVRVTADAREGLWPVGCGEHYGVTKTFVHGVPTTKTMSLTRRGVVVGNGGDHDDGSTKRNENVVIMQESNDEMPMEEEMCRIFGRSSVDYIASVFSDDSPDSRNVCVKAQQDGQVHVIPPENDGSDVNPTAIGGGTGGGELATSTWTSSIWSPCPSRSLGFAIGPFSVLYDPEYYSREDRDDDEDEEELGEEGGAGVVGSAGGGVGGQRDGKVEQEEEEEEPPTIKETAGKEGEGIRQVYFAMREERPYIHANADVIGVDGTVYVRYSPPQEIDVELKKQIIQSVIGSTAGVTNRALSLMRDILSLPSYRTKSYTQIWIPDAVDGGISCGTLHACPEVSCNCFLGGAILDSRLLHPIGYRLPFYAGGRVLQFAQARCAVRGWIISALPLGGSDDVGHGYIHTLIENFIMSLYERAHGAYGEGGSKHGFFFSKRFAISSGLNSKNMDFLPVVNVEEEDIAFVPVHGAVGSLPIGEFVEEIVYNWI